MPAILVKYLAATPTRGTRLSVSAYGHPHKIYARAYEYTVSGQGAIVAQDYARTVLDRRNAISARVGSIAHDVEVFSIHEVAP
jgi:hypothetical protein